MCVYSLCTFHINCLFFCLTLLSRALFSIKIKKYGHRKTNKVCSTKTENERGVGEGVIGELSGGRGCGLKMQSAIEKRNQA